MTKRGFTLIELLVVITIIAILAVIGLTVFSGVQRNARDAKRKADIDAISNAMEAHYGQFAAGQYAGLCQTVGNPATYDCISKDWFAAGTGLPADPQASATVRYCWTTGASCDNISGTAIGAGQPPAGTTSWTICATLEQPANTTYCRNNRQ